ncbi:quinone oxidoreductase family protein [Kiloniella sp. b19]|uniref:quinone oxidoreductase family protein n=1 Tax=Kiloniella sp. GXU_MW_B19 TaxID=3141326 RepID=UPI0031DBD2F4
MTSAMIVPETGSPDVLKQQTIERPEPASGEILVRNHAAAVNFIDTIIRRGEMPEGMMPALPHIPGVEGAGVIEALGPDVRGFSVGDRVAWMGPVGAGGYGTHSVVATPCVTALDEGISFEQAAALPVNALTAWHMLVNLGHLKSGDTILVHAAAGGVGTMILQIAKHLGATVIASVSTGKEDYARQQGADYVIDYKKENLVESVRELTGGKGVDLTLNPIAGETLKTDLELLAPLGTAVIFGFLGGMPSGSFAEDLARHFGKSVAVRVSDIYSHFTSRPEVFNADLGKVFGLLSSGVLSPNIRVLPIESASEAHRQLESGQTTGKLVLTMA